MLLDILLVIGVLISLLSGVDLFLRPHQRRQVQDFLEEITLRSDDLDLPDLRDRVQEPGVLAVLVMLTYCLFASVVMVVLLVQAPMWKPGGMLREAFGPQGQTVQVLAILISAGTLIFAWKWPLPQVMRWILATDTISESRSRYRRIVLVGFLFFFGYQLVVARLTTGAWLPPIGDGADVKGQTYFMWSLLPVWSPFTIFWIIHQGCGLALRPPGRSKSWTILLFRGTLWRIIEYGKGAVGAIALLLTIFLTVLKLRLG